MPHYNSLDAGGREPLRPARAGLVCMVFSLGPAALEELRATMSFTFTLGDWAVSTGAHEQTVAHGPFPPVEAAFDFGRTRAGAVRFVSDRTADFDAI